MWTQNEKQIFTSSDIFKICSSTFSNSSAVLSSFLPSSFATRSASETAYNSPWPRLGPFPTVSLPFPLPPVVFAGCCDWATPKWRYQRPFWGSIGSARSTRCNSPRRWHGWGPGLRPLWRGARCTGPVPRGRRRRFGGRIAFRLEEKDCCVGGGVSRSCWRWFGGSVGFREAICCGYCGRMSDWPRWSRWQRRPCRGNKAAGANQSHPVEKKEKRTIRNWILNSDWWITEAENFNLRYAYMKCTCEISKSTLKRSWVFLAIFYFPAHFPLHMFYFSILCFFSVFFRLFKDKCWARSWELPLKDVY